MRVPPALWQAAASEGAESIEALNRSRPQVTAEIVGRAPVESPKKGELLPSGQEYWG